MSSLKEFEDDLYNMVAGEGAQYKEQDQREKEDPEVSEEDSTEDSEDEK